VRRGNKGLQEEEEKVKMENSFFDLLMKKSSEKVKKRND
jgi:hypothetical protein